MRTFSVHSRVEKICRVRDWGEESIYGAAYVLTDRAYAQIEGNRKTILKITLTPKNALNKKEITALKRLLDEELRMQKLRWEIAKNNQDIREYIVDLALRQAQAPKTPPAPSAPTDLTAEERRQIEQLIAEVEAEIKERAGKMKDPLNIAAVWESRHADASEAR